MGEAKRHELKTWTEFYEHVVGGDKPFEFRKDDRGFNVGDVLVLREYDPMFGVDTGDQCERVVTYILRDFDGIAEGYCVMGLSNPDHAAALAAKGARIAELDALLSDSMTVAGKIAGEEVRRLEARIAELETAKQDAEHFSYERGYDLASRQKNEHIEKLNARIAELEGENKRLNGILEDVTFVCFDGPAISSGRTTHGEEARRIIQILNVVKWRNNNLLSMVECAIDECRQWELHHEGKPERVEYWRERGQFFRNWLGKIGGDVQMENILDKAVATARREALEDSLTRCERLLADRGSALPTVRDARVIGRAEGEANAYRVVIAELRALIAPPEASEPSTGKDA